MKALTLQGHSRPIRSLAFSKDGNTIFSASVDRTVLSWDIQSAKKLNTYSHAAALTSIKLSSDDRYLISGDATGTIYIWDLSVDSSNSSSSNILKIENSPSLSIKSIDLSINDIYLLVTYSGRTKTPNTFIDIYSFSSLLAMVDESNKTETQTKSEDIYGSESLYSKYLPKEAMKSEKQTLTVKHDELQTYKSFKANKDSNYTKAIFCIASKCILASREDGIMELITFNTDQVISQKKFHNDIIYDFDLNEEKGLIFTASRDGFAKLINIDTFEEINSFNPSEPTRNLNSCILLFWNEVKPTEISINVDDLFGSGKDITQIKSKFFMGVVAGGQDSKEVTTTHTSKGGFELVGYDVFDKEGEPLFMNLSHFGPVNVLISHGGLIASGAEDSTVKLYKINELLLQK